MTKRRGGIEIKSDDALDADSKNHRHVWNKRFTSFLFVCLMIIIILALFGILIFSTALFLYWMRTNSWGMLESALRDVLKIGMGFFAGLLAHYGIIKNAPSS